MTFQDYDTYDWYLKGVPDHLILVMDPSELPDKAEEVKFWQRSHPGRNDAYEYIFYAVGKVQITSDFE